MSANLVLGFPEFILGMGSRPEQRIYEFDDFRLDACHLMLYHKGAEVSLVPKAARTLLVLLEHNGKIVSKEELLDTVWPDTVVEESNLFAYLTLLRKILGNQEDGHPYVETLRRRGYRFNGNVRVVHEKDSNNCESGNSVPAQSVLPALDSTAEPVPAAETNSYGKRYVLAISLAAILIAAIVAASFNWQKGQATVTNAGGPRTLAILPFRPLVAGVKEEALELGMADTLITRLSSNRSIIVRPMSSVRGFSGPDQDAIKAGQALGVESVLEGSLQRSGDSIRVNVRLIRVADGTAIWADTFDKKFTDIFDVQNAIATRIANALDLQLTGDERARLEKPFTNSPEAYEYYLRCRQNVYKVTEDGIRQGIGFCEQAIKADPNYALAYAEMADAYRRLAVAGFVRPKDAFPQAEAFARKAIELDGSLATPHVVLAWLDYVHYWNWGSAETRFKRALELEPNNSDAHIAYASLLSFEKRYEEAVAEARRARELSPMTLIVLALESQILGAAGYEDEAMRQAKKALDIDPNFWPARVQLAESYRRQKRYPEAIVEYEKAKELAPASFSPLMWIANVYCDMGDKERLYATLNEMERRSTQKFVPFHNFAKIYNCLGQKDKALDLLERSVAEREVHLVGIVNANSYDNLRSDARFIAILRKMNVNE